MGEKENRLYADIVLPVAREPFTFAVDEGLSQSIRPGFCVKAEIGRKIYAGIVWEIHRNRPPYKTVKTVSEYVDQCPSLSETDISFWKWMTEYYMCTPGEVMRAALPSSLKPRGFSNEQFLKDTYRPATVEYISFHPSIDSSARLNEKFESLKKAPRQYDALISIVSLMGNNIFHGEILRREAQADSVTLKSLEKKKIIAVSRRAPSPGNLPPLPERLPSLSPAQCLAINSVNEFFRRKDSVLLHGVTGSGKTEIYLHLIDKQLRQGNNVIYLLPEIAMTSQIIDRIKKWFGERVIVYHSRLPERKRVENYRRANLSQGGELILGTRSALFLPVDRLGLIVVDEEHDPGYKQEDPAPRYNARDSALVMARMSGAKAVLGSATPSVESYANALEGKYGLVTLEERYGDSPLPNIIVSDTMTAVRRGERTAHFNKITLDRMAEALARGSQVMLFQNRRGFAPYVECGECGRIEKCTRCSVTLTYHKGEKTLLCHYCGQRKAAPVKCPGCGRTAIHSRGFGTEKVEEELAAIFPEASIARLDRDTATTVKKYHSIITSFEEGRTDILIGTRMITKGFDFGNVSLVGILNADNLLNYPDFRAGEKAFQTMVQMAGRAGRRGEQGQVVIQTSDPANRIIRQVSASDYAGMVREQLAERENFNYPPYCRLVSVVFKHQDPELIGNAAGFFAARARKVFGDSLLGPQPPVVDRVKNEHRLAFLLKIPKTDTAGNAKVKLRELITLTKEQAAFKNIKTVIDVDPQ